VTTAFVDGSTVRPLLNFGKSPTVPFAEESSSAKNFAMPSSLPAATSQELGAHACANLRFLLHIDTCVCVLGVGDSLVEGTALGPSHAGRRRRRNQRHQYALKIMAENPNPFGSVSQHTSVQR
jgi:hypothetical protein